MRARTWNQQIVKEKNKKLVLETIHKKAPISRADIAQTTGLTKGTVSSLVSELINEQFVYESGHGESSGGRRPIMLIYNKKAGYSIGINLDVNYILGVLTDLYGNIISEYSIKLADESSYQEIIDNLFEVIDYFIDVVPRSPYGIIGIGVGVPGIINNRGMLLLAPNLDWENVDLKDVIEQKYHLPVTIENEANAGVFGEMKFGLGENSNHLIYISVGIGIGVGQILNGELFKGYNGFSGELGHMTIKYDGIPCRCGNIGCWEVYASERALINKAKQVLQLNPEQPLTLDDIIERANNNNEQTIELLQEIGYFLGTGINNIINIFNPEQIIIGNRMTFAEKWLIDAIKKQIEKGSNHFQHQNLRLHFSKLNIYAPAIGMAAFSIEQFLNYHFQ